ncbi:MAG: MFS transporter [Candidatus Bipolaricaulota bacterium]
MKSSSFNHEHMNYSENEANLNSDGPDPSKIRNFVLLSFTFLGVSLSFTAFPLLVLPLEKSLDISHGLAGLLYTIMFIASAAARFVESFAADRYGKEGFLLHPGFLMAAGLLGFAFSPTYWLIAICICIAGLGNGFFIPAGFAAVSELFPKRRGKFIGIYDSIFPLSALAAYGIVTLSDPLGGWRYAVGLIGVYLFLVSTALYFGYSSPERVVQSAESRFSSPLDYLRLVFERAKNSPVFWKIVVLSIPVSIFAKGAVNFIPAYLVQGRGLSEGLASVMYMVFMGLIIAGKLLSGGMLDRKGARWTFLVDMGLVLLGLFLFSQVPGLLALTLGVLILAPARGGVYTVMHTHLLDSLPPESVNLLYGLFMVSLSVFGSIGPGLVGALIDTLGFRWTFVVLLFVVLSTLPLILNLKSSDTESGPMVT